MFQVGQNWLTWNADRPQRALKQGLVFQVNVRNAKMNGVIDYANDATGRNGRFVPGLGFQRKLGTKRHIFVPGLSFKSKLGTKKPGFVPVAHKKLFLHTNSKTVAQCMCYRVHQK